MSTFSFSMLHTLKPFQCPKCNSTYSSKDTTRFHNVTRFPRILTCCHSTCEFCLQTAEKQKGFSCPTCQEQIDVAEDPLSKFPPDIHALGIICANLKNSLPSIKVKMVPTSELKRTQSQDSLKKPGSSIICGHCKQNPALWQCDECQLNFCSICFKEIHTDKSKKRHEGKKIFAELYHSIVQEGCSEHENKMVEFYCEVDDQLTCSYCMLMGNHVGHEVKTLIDKNKSCVDDLKNALDDITEMQKQMKYTDHLLCEEIPKEKVDISDTIKIVHNYFHELHAALQMREAELINDLTEISQRNVKTLEEMRLRVTSYENDLASLKKDAESLIENPCLAVSAPALLKKLEECKALPCYLVPLSSKREKKFELSINLDSDFGKKIKDIGEINFALDSRFSLLTSQELPDDYCTDLPESFSAKFQVTLDNESATTDTFSEDSLSVASHNLQYSNMQASHKYRDFTKMQPEKVIVSHVKTPSCFYVQRCSEARKLKAMSDSIDRWCKSFESKKTIVSTVETGDLYLVRYSVDNKWYRGRVKSILSPEDPLNEKVIGKKSPIKTEDGKIQVKNRESRAEVFYIDYGNTEIISLSNIKNIQARFLNLPGVAKECSLADILPANGIGWCPEAVKTFTKLVSNKSLVMQVLEDRNNVFQIDLCQVADNDITNDIPVSVRDALVFLELAIFPSGTKPTAKRNRTERNYMPPESLRVNANICAIVSHVQDPSHFYVQQMSTASYLSNLIFEMNETYNKEANTMLHGVYAPRIGMACAAQFSVDKQWYRAKVIGLPGGAKVEVQYVDFGNKEVIHYKFLRKLFNKFYKLNIQAIPCKLANVTYNQAKEWSKEAKEWLTNIVSRKQLTLQSLGMIPGENKAEVVLNYINENEDLCVNALMVEEGFAVSKGELSTPARTKREPPKNVPILKETVAARDQIVNVIPPPVPAPLPFYVELSDIISLEEEASGSKTSENSVVLVADEESPVSSPPKKKYPTLAASPPPPGVNYVEAHVSHIVSPGLFFIRLAGDHEKKLNVLMDELQNVYKSLEGELVECSVGKSYAVFSTNQKKWFRGTVLEKRSEDIMKMHFVDYGNTENVEKRFIRKLAEKFSKDQSFSVRCHLDGIIPAGGSTDWPHTACDMFRRLVDPHPILLLSSKGEPEKETKSLPADLLIEKIVAGGALEPTRIERISICAEIIKHGLGLPTRRKSTSPPISKTEETVQPKAETPTCSKEVLVDPIPEIKAPIKAPIEVENITSPEIKIIPEPPSFQWKPSVPPFEPVFRGFVTNIGEDGSIQLYVLPAEEKGVSQADTIKKALKFKYSKGTYETLKKPPPIGEACIAKFSVDNEWYRAEILSVYPGKVKVNFVDYGNNEIVPLSFIRTDIALKTFPRQCLHCALFGIDVDATTKWDNELLTFLHTQLVDTEVTVEIQGPRDKKGRLPCVITTPSGINVAELLISMGFNEKDESSIPLSLPGVGDYEVSTTFTKAMELREGDILPVCVTQVVTENVVYLQLLKIPEPKNKYEVKLNEIHMAFLELIEELRKNAEKFPKLKEPMPGMPCCAKYSYDNDWYRCEITDLTEDGAIVLYVDYGNSETVPSDNLREMENRFIDFPVQLHFCKLRGMKPVGGTWDKQVKETLINQLLVTNRELYAKIVVPGQISEVDLLVKAENGKYELAYKELLEKKLIDIENYVQSYS